MSCVLPLVVLEEGRFEEARTAWPLTLLLLAGLELTTPLRLWLELEVMPLLIPPLVAAVLLANIELALRAVMEAALVMFISAVLVLTPMPGLDVVVAIVYFGVIIRLWAIWIVWLILVGKELVLLLFFFALINK